jgi:hypothetical protein
MSVLQVVNKNKNHDIAQHKFMFWPGEKYQTTG